MVACDKKGFTLIELIVIIAIIAIIGMITVSIYQRGIISSNEASTFMSLRAINNAEMQFKLSHPVYGTLADLKEANLISDPYLANGLKSGYKFQATPYPEVAFQWYAEGIPERYSSSGIRSFYTDETGAIRLQDTGKGEFISREEASLWPMMNN